MYETPKGKRNEVLEYFSLNHYHNLVGGDQFTVEGFK